LEGLSALGAPSLLLGRFGFFFAERLDLAALAAFLGVAWLRARQLQWRQATNSCFPRAV